MFSMGSKWRMLKRIAPPTMKANTSNAAMHTTARLPTTPASSGALTRKPLPMIEASGVTVAFQFDEPDRRLENARYPPRANATKMMVRLVICVIYCACSFGLAGWK